MWNSLGTDLLVEAIQETSASSYYGEHQLYYLTVRGDSYCVKLSTFTLILKHSTILKLT